MKFQLRRPMFLIFMSVFLGTLLFKPLLLKDYDRERLPFLTLYENKEKSCIVIGTIKNIYRSEGQSILVLKDCTIAGYEENEARPCGGVRLYTDESLSFHCGQKIRAYGGIKIFLSAQNPGQFDAYEYYRREHIYANVYAEKLYIVDDGRERIADSLTSIRNKFKNTFERLYPKDEAGIIFALVTGDKSLLNRDSREDFKKAGISHILAISGLHITFICMGFNKILKKLTVRKGLRDILTVLFTFVFVLFSGAGISVIRAGIMCCCLLLAENVKMRYDLLSALFFAGAVELVIYPLEGLTSSFLLSYLAIIGVYAAGRIGAGAFSGLVITLFTLPVTLYFYYEVSMYGVLASMPVIPVTGLVLGFALISGLVGMISIKIAMIPAGIAFAGVSFMEMVSKAAQKLPFSIITVGKPGVVGIVVYYILLIMALGAIKKCREELKRIEKKGRKGRRIKKQAILRLCGIEAGLALFCILALIIHRPEKGITFLSVGQGDGIVYHDRDVILFDCGSSSEQQVGKYILSPFIKRMGENIIDLVIISHMDSDHTSAVFEILESMPEYKGEGRFLAEYTGNIAIKKLALPRVDKWSDEYARMVTLAKGKGVEVFFLEQGDRINAGKASMLCLWPRDAKESDNETSLVMALAIDKMACLMTGDATTESEEGIAGAYPEGFRALVSELGYSPRRYLLKVGHHGSKTSTGENLLRWGDFDTAVISVGHFNTYGHPRQEVLERLYDAGIEVHRTDKEGAVKE